MATVNTGARSGYLRILDLARTVAGLVEAVGQRFLIKVVLIRGHRFYHTEPSQGLTEDLQIYVSVIQHLYHCSILWYYVD